MSRRNAPRALAPWQLRWMLNLYPPLLFNAVRVVQVSSDFHHLRVRVARVPWTRNLHGTMFGGTIYAAADPFPALMFWQIFAHRGRHVQVWLRRARVHYKKPAATALTLDFHIDAGDVAEAEHALAGAGRFARYYATDAVDRAGDVCCTVDTEVYLRVPREGQREGSRF
jgi:hypothetical protein